MTRVSLELVPRSREGIQSEIDQIVGGYPQIDTINVPDLLRFELRSWEACAMAKPHFAHAVPHVRAIDINPYEPLPMAQAMREAGIDEVLVVTGDLPQDMSRRIYHTTAVEVIRMFKEQMPGVKVYAAIDPYRTSLIREYHYAEQKIRAGADGFFTQPFFDTRLMSVYADMLREFTVFWGISPVLGEKSKSYWEIKNNTVFPKEFQFSMDYNTKYAREAIDLVRQVGGHAYLMPLRVDIAGYLGGIFA